MMRNWCLLALCFLPVSSIAFADECVVLLHGMGRSHSSMELIEKELIENQYLVWNQSYDSTGMSVSTLADEVITKSIKYCNDQQTDKINFITHSIGGILVRYFLQENRIKNLGRIVMLSPPNHGSEIADLLKENFVYQKWMGPAGQEIGTGENSLPNQLKPVAAEIGIIAGSSTSDPWFSPLIPGEDDGKVSIESARLEEMKDFLVIASGHSFIMRNDEAIKQSLFFLVHGKFCR